MRAGWMVAARAVAETVVAAREEEETVMAERVAEPDARVRIGSGMGVDATSWWDDGAVLACVVPLSRHCVGQLDMDAAGVPDGSAAATTTVAPSAVTVRSVH